ncbi:malonic semialdehyde reductase [Rhodococcus sp. 06-1059B-a]|nr:malonic semialdehyde reductase [Rhodococcus sp. 06-1059B-a]OZD65725.1 malonic semialdehyde reductase [Rhodococcus sp. 06-1059B-a]
MTVSLRRLEEPALKVLFSGARTANSFAPTEVADHELAAIWELAKWPPTAANVQPLRVVFVRTADGRTRLLSHMNEGNTAKTESAPAVAILAVDTDYHDHIPTVLPFRPELREVFAEDDAMRRDVGSFNSALQAGYFVLAVRASGLAAGPMAGFDKTTLDEDFFPDGSWKSILVVNIGHPGEDPWFGRLPRLDSTQTVGWA